MSNLAEELKGIQHEREVLVKKQQLLIEKGLNSDDPEEIIKAETVLRDINQKPDVDRKSYVIDPFAFQTSIGFKEKPYSLSYNVLRNMAKTPVINAIIRTRINQVATFGEPQKDRYSVGYVIQKRISFANLNTQPEKLTKQEEKEIQFLYDFIEHCGLEYSWDTDDFPTFLRKLTRDSLTFDQATFEIVSNQIGQPHQFLATDAATYRIAETYDEADYAKMDIVKRPQPFERPQKEKRGYYADYVQIYQSKIINYFYPWELCFAVRNPQTDVTMNGYGISELEEMISLITAMLWGEDYNRRFFKQGAAPKGILKVKGNLNENKLQEFRQQWNATMRGVQNSWKTPVMNADEMEWVDLQSTNRDMEFSNWLEYLIKVACAIYAIDPAEVNFPLKGGANDGGGLFESDNTKRLEFSKDKGLHPLLKFIQKKLNKYLISHYFNGKYEFVFKGMDSMSPQEELDMDIKAVQNLSMLNEIRAKRGDKPVPGGDVILNPIFMQQKQMDAMQQQAEQEQGGEHEAYMEPAVNSNENEENPFQKALDSYIEKLNSQ